MTPIYHPNISEIGMVCLGGYGTHWVPSVQLDELCIMLWDMLRYHNYDIRSPYNRDAALWVANQTSILFPTDARSLRDLRAAQGRMTASASDATRAVSSGGGTNGRAKGMLAAEETDENSSVNRVRKFVERYRRGANRIGSESRALDRGAIAAANSERQATSTEPQAVVQAEAGSEPRGDNIGGDEGMIILDPSPPTTVEPTAHMPATDEILFID